MSPSSPSHVLILCPGDPARAVIAEYLLRWKSRGRFLVYSASTAPASGVHPLVEWVLRERYGINAREARAHSAADFVGTHFHGLIAIRDKNHEIAPSWADTPVLAHWGCSDPAVAPGTESQRQRAFLNAASQLSAQADLLCSLPAHVLGGDRNLYRRRLHPAPAH